MILVVLLGLISLHMNGIGAALSALVILILEGFFLVTFLRFLLRDTSNLSTVITMSIISIATYVYLFPYINAQELWVDEIQVIRFGQLPLSVIAHTVMHEHVAVPPLDYWNMWMWNHIAQAFPVSMMEFIYRVPYMIMHTLSAILIALSLRKILPKVLSYGDRMLIFFAFCLYFYNPWLLTYSYEVRYYGPMLLGGAVVLYLYYLDKLFDPKYSPVLLLFALNSVYQFIIVAPFIWLGLFVPPRKIGSIALLLGFAGMAFLILPFVYIPGSVHGAPAISRIQQSLLYLYYFYFDAPWKQVIAAELVILAVLFRRRSAWLMGICLVMALVVTLLNARMDYQFFGAKHFLFVMPLLTMALLELFLVHRSAFYRWIVVIAMTALFILPYFAHIQEMVKSGVTLAKSPMGLKVVFQKSLVSRANIIVEYGDASEEDVAYMKKAVSWYSEQYKKITVREYRFGEGCTEYKNSKNYTLYVTQQTSMCHGIQNNIIYLYGARFIAPHRYD